MTPNLKKLRDLRDRIPSFACVPGCHDCCGPVTASSEEMSRLPRKSDAARDAALAELSCPHLGEQGCEVYGERPLICRLFGTTPRLAIIPGLTVGQVYFIRVYSTTTRSSVAVNSVGS